MLDALRFVQGSVAKKDFLPALSHFVIENGTVRGYDGTMAICSPINLDLSCKPKADTFVKAIAACGDGTITLTMTPAGRLSVKCGKHRFLIDCHPEEETPHAKPDGAYLYELGGAAKVFYDALQKIEPFVGNDASRPWSNGVLIDGKQMFATNNVILANIWTGIDFPHKVCIPHKAVKELIRVKQAPVSVQLAKTAITFHFEDKRWIRTQLIDSMGWPDIGKVLDRPPANQPKPIDPELFPAIKTLKPFVDKLSRVYFDKGAVTTTLSDEGGARVEVASVEYEGVYGIEMMLLLEGAATSIDWTNYPKACLWFGDKIRGAIIGLKS